MNTLLHFLNLSSVLQPSPVLIIMLLVFGIVSAAPAFAIDFPGDLNSFLLKADTINITCNQGLSFGKIIPYSGGTVTIKPQNGKKTSTGGLIALSQPAGQEAEFTVTGPKQAAFELLLPDEIILIREGGLEQMKIGNIRIHPNNIGFLGGNGRQEFSLGATLTVDSQQKGGIYSGHYQVVVVYE